MGLVYADYESERCTVKESGYQYKRVILERRLPD